MLECSGDGGEPTETMRTRGTGNGLKGNNRKNLGPELLCNSPALNWKADYQAYGSEGSGLEKVKVQVCVG